MSLSWPIKGGGEFIVTDDDARAYLKRFPNLDVFAELRDADDWLTANPRKIKVHYGRFILNWLRRAERKRWEELRKDRELLGYFPREK